MNPPDLSVTLYSVNPRPGYKGMYVYCSADEKKRIKAVAKSQRLSLSAYVLSCVMPDVEKSEKKG